MDTLVIDATTREKLLAATTSRRIRLLDEDGEIFGEFVKITKVVSRDGTVHYVEGDWPTDADLNLLENRERKDLKYTPEQIQEMLRRITASL